MSTGSSERADNNTHPTEDMKEKARQATEQAKSTGKEQLERYRGTGADELSRVAQSVKVAASDLERDRPGLSRYVASAANSMERIADDMRSKSVDELFRDVNRMARQNPGLFIAGSVALGFGLMRFAKASSQHTADDYERHPIRDRMHRNHDEHERGDMAGHTVGDGYIPDQDELNRHVYSGEPGGSVGSVSNAGGTRTSSTSSSSGLGSALGGATGSAGATGGTTGGSSVGSSGANSSRTNPAPDSGNRNTSTDSGVTTRTDPRIRSAGTTPTNVNRDGKGGV